MIMKIYFYILLSFFVFKNLISDFILDSDLSKSLSSLYYLNPKLKYEREILKSKDELFLKL